MVSDKKGECSTHWAVRTVQVNWNEIVNEIHGMQVCPRFGVKSMAIQLYHTSLFRTSDEVERWWWGGCLWWVCKLWWYDDVLVISVRASMSNACGHICILLRSTERVATRLSATRCSLSCLSSTSHRTWSSSSTMSAYVLSQTCPVILRMSTNTRQFVLNVLRSGIGS